MGESATLIDAIKNQNIILKEIINGSWNAIGIIDKTTRFKFINKAFVPVLGYTQNEILKMKLDDVVLSEYKQPLYQLLEDNTKNEYINKITLGCIRKDKQKVYLEIVIHLMNNQKMYVINAHDVTADVDEKNLVDQFIIQFQSDDKGNFLKGSDAFYRLFGYTFDKLVYTNSIELLHSITKPDMSNGYTHSLAHGLSWSGQLVLKKINGTPIYVEFSSKPTRNKYGDIVGYSAVMIDISSEVKLQEQEEFLEEKLIDEEEKLAIMSETMRTVAHEWRQPLNTISLEAQSLSFDLDFDDEIDKNSIREKLDGISQSTQKLSKVIESFQAITELKGSKKKRNIKDILVESLRIAELYEKEFVKEEYGETRSFRTYPKELSSAISSILINAKEFTSNLDQPMVSLKTYENGTNIVCEISNNGGHIPEDIIDKIFTPYFSTKSEKNGVGLSLYTCKIIIELHLKGTIKVKNIDDNIVNFKLTFPIGALEE